MKLDKDEELNKYFSAVGEFKKRVKITDMVVIGYAILMELIKLNENLQHQQQPNKKITKE